MYIGCDTSSISNCISQLGKLHLFLVYWSTRYYSWFLVAITCERFMCVCLPRKVKQCCTRRAALFVIYVITGSIMMLNIHLLYGFDNKSQWDQSVRLCPSRRRCIHISYLRLGLDWPVYVLSHTILVLLFGHVSILV